jgi:hypothetical protein
MGSIGQSFESVRMEPKRSRPEKSLSIRTYVAFSPKPRLYIYVLLEDFVHMSSLLSVIQPEEEVERSPPAPCHCVPACMIP